MILLMVMVAVWLVLMIKYGGGAMRTRIVTAVLVAGLSAFLISAPVHAQESDNVAQVQAQAPERPTPPGGRSDPVATVLAEVGNALAEEAAHDLRSVEMAERVAELAGKALVHMVDSAVYFIEDQNICVVCPD